jgi:hypothetical protein
VKTLVLWKTNKDQETPSEFPAYVVYVTDYSPSRKAPLKRTVQIAPDEATANDFYDNLWAANIKRGWQEVF